MQWDVRRVLNAAHVFFPRKIRQTNNSLFNCFSVKVQFWSFFLDGSPVPHGCIYIYISLKIIYIYIQIYTLIYRYMSGLCEIRRFLICAVTPITPVLEAWDLGLLLTHVHTLEFSP